MLYSKRQIHVNSIKKLQFLVDSPSANGASLATLLIIFPHPHTKYVTTITMTDVITPETTRTTTPKKIFKPSKKTRTPIRVKPPAPQHADFPREAAFDTPPAAESQPKVSSPSSEGAPAPNNSPEDKTLLREQEQEPEEELEEASRGKSMADEPEETGEKIEGGPTVVGDKEPIQAPKSPTGKVEAGANIEQSPTAEAFKEQKHLEMSNSGTSSPGEFSSSRSDGTREDSKSPRPDEKVISSEKESEKADEASRSAPTENGNLEKPTNHAPAQNMTQTAPDDADSEPESQDGTASNLREPGDVSKVADGTFRDAGDSTATNAPINNMGEPNVSEISKTVHPSSSRESSKLSDQKKEDGSREIDNMGKPAHVERSIEIPLQRGSPPNEKQESEGFSSHDLGDFEELPSTKDLPSLDDLPDLRGKSDQDPPEEVLDPKVHSPNVRPIPKIPKIGNIGSTPPLDLRRLARGLAGHVVDDVGNIVDEAENVLGHATGDLPAMVGRKVSEDGEVYASDGSIIGYVSDNFVKAPEEPREIPSHVLEGLKVDQEGNILGSNGNIVGKFHERPDGSSFAKSASPDVAAGEKTEEEGKPKEKVNAHTGGSPSDIFLDVKSTTEGIQLTIRIPTTFSRPAPDVHVSGG
ncbi:hypothetical protein GGR50DRAFT_650633 [Xylaria sp. CBS 124048]|nr:hypothetical protein GGR50DRAFT_650633 [Xylaria sp. CBS 124048]